MNDLRTLALLIFAAAIAVCVVGGGLAWAVWTALVPGWLHHSVEFIGWWVIFGLLVMGGYVLTVRTRPPPTFVVRDKDWRNVEKHRNSG